MEKEATTVRREHEALGAIKAFVSDLVCAFRTKEISPLLLYDRFLSKLSLNERLSVKRLFTAFNTFLQSHRKAILENTLSSLPTGVTIGYSPRVYIEIQKFISDGDESSSACIRRHLLTIMAILSPDAEVRQELEKALKEVPVDMKIAKLKVDETTKEGKFVKNMMTKIATKLEAVEIDSQDPLGMMMQIAKSGIMKDIQNDFQGGQGLNQRKLLMTFRSMIDSVMPEEDEEPTKDEKPTKEAGDPSPRGGKEEKEKEDRKDSS